ncbi:MAG: isopentenyl-diphosphate Delta-isomerase [Bacteroidetes bacterium]|nr:isopentenyl-diphosphate Delta-isomerase [Bacteroidota bacterium]
MDKVIIVNEKDEWMGTMGKMEAHEKGILHRAFSVFILNDQKQILLQQRALNKYHSAGLWSNTCCSHPHPGESTLAGAQRRLNEELGFECALEPIFILRYKSDVGNGLVENEVDHIYIGKYNGLVQFNAEEVNDYKYVSIEELKKWMETSPDNFTAWFHLAMPRFLQYLDDIHLAA